MQCDVDKHLLKHVRLKNNISIEVHICIINYKVTNVAAYFGDT